MMKNASFQAVACTRDVRVLRVLGLIGECSRSFERRATVGVRNRIHLPFSMSVGSDVVNDVRDLTAEHVAAKPKNVVVNEQLMILPWTIILIPNMKSDDVGHRAN